MISNEIQQLLNNPSEWFFGHESDTNIFYIGYPAERLEEIHDAARAIDTELSGVDPYISINKNAKHNRFSITIGSFKEGNPLFFADVSGLGGDYQECLYVKSSEEKVKLSFHVHNVEKTRTPEKIDEIRKRENHDELDVVTGEEPYYENEIITVTATFSVQSDDQYDESSPFIEMKAGNAMYIAEHLRKQQIEKRKKGKAE
ncbi:MAG TPA: hypothetical protein VNX40_05105 [Mucilaginibacter sp.]|jgi:hypothetical protein|nr:hypothetical protein [Mucilaginibacter sp.]